MGLDSTVLPERSSKMCVGVTHHSESPLFRNVRQTHACTKCKAQKHPASFLQLEPSIWIIPSSQYLDVCAQQQSGYGGSRLAAA